MPCYFLGKRRTRTNYGLLPLSAGPDTVAAVWELLRNKADREMALAMPSNCFLVRW